LPTLLSYTLSSVATGSSSLHYKECQTWHSIHSQNLHFPNSYHIIFIFIPWIRTGLQNPYGYGNSQICL